MTERVIGQVPNDLLGISSLLPSKNGEKYLAQLIPQILDMLNVDDELIVINDGSTDKSANILVELSKLDSRIKILSTKGIGLVASLNLGIKEAKNPWIARFDVDDEYLNNRLKEQRRFIGSDVAVVFSDYTFMSSSGICLGSIPTAILPNPTKLSLITSQRTPHPVALINKKMIFAAGGYKINDFPCEDLGLWLRLADLGKIVSTPRRLLYYRLSGGSISSLHRSQQIDKKNKLIHEFKHWKDLFQLSIDELPKTIEFYIKQTSSTARIVLHLRDISIAARLSGTSLGLKKLASVLPVQTIIRIPIVVVEIYAKIMIRRTYRLVKNFF